MLCLSSQVIAAPLTQILNLSIQTRIFPDSLKNDKVTPCFKKGDKSDKTNYRPISILPIVSQIIERHISDQIKEYLNCPKLLYERQPGFRSNHSWESALTAIIDDWVSAIDRNEIVGTVLLDLSKAFDLVDHKILLSKLKCYQFNGLNPIFISDNSKSLLQESYLVQCIYPPECHKDQSWNLFFFWYILMT